MRPRSLWGLAQMKVSTLGFIALGVALMHALVVIFIGPGSFSIVMSHFDSTEPFTLAEQIQVILFVALNLPAYVLMIPMVGYSRALPQPLPLILYFVVNSMSWGIFVAISVAVIASIRSGRKRPPGSTTTRG
jgi:DMSO reductase anchor subunit